MANQVMIVRMKRFAKSPKECQKLISVMEHVKSKNVS